MSSDPCVLCNGVGSINVLIDGKWNNKTCPKCQGTGED